MPLADARISPVVAIIQARMSSTRLPGKVMLEICGRPILSHVVQRVREARLVDKVVVATTVHGADDRVLEWCGKNGVQCFRGSLEDVLDRYCKAAVKHSAKTVVRITADCPMLDPRLVDEIIGMLANGGLDYASVGPTYPDGLDAEAFTVEALHRAHREARLKSEREHVTPYIWKNPHMFATRSIQSPIDLSGMRWTVDDQRDFDFVKAVCEGLGCVSEVFHMEDVLGFLKAHPETLGINSGTMRNEGYAKSVREDSLCGKPDILKKGAII
jgi:spore coat polysaccharide biosynthesis protein SpsF